MSVCIRLRPSLQMFQDLRRVPRRFHLRVDLLDLPVRPDHECAPFDAHYFPPIHRLFFPDAESLRGSLLVVGQKHERQVVLRSELLLRRRLIGRDPDHRGAFLFELLHMVAELARLERAPRRVGFRIEVQHYPLSAPGRKTGNLRRLVAHLQHASPLPNLRLNSSVITVTFACPRVARIACPTRKLITVVFPPRNCSTCFGFVAITSSMTRSSAPVSLICCSPSRSIIVAGACPVRNIFGKISFASLPETSPFAIILTSSPRCAALTGESAISLPSALSIPIRSPITQFADVLGSPDIFATLSKYAAEARLAVSPSASYSRSPYSPMNRARRFPGSSGI